MKTILLSLIKIPPNRQRRNFDVAKLNEFGESIKKTGLLHPINLRKGDIRKGEDANGIYLSSGERRLRAIADIYALGGNFRHDGQEVPAGEIPYVDLDDLDELAREEAEYEENRQREDLTWQEDADTVRRLFELRSKQAARAGLPKPTVASVAEEHRGSSEGVHQEITRRQIIVAQHMGDSEIKNAKSVDEAFKILRRKEDVQKRVQLAETIGKSYSANTAHQILNEDSLAWMAKCPADTFDVICTDPIFGIGADEFGDSGGRAAGAHTYGDSYDQWKRDMPIFAHQGFRLAKPLAHLYAFCDITRFEEFKQILSAAGWQTFRTPITWHYPNGNRTPWVDSGPQRKTGWILFARKGAKPVTRIYPDLVTYASDENLGHHAQKPVALIVDLLRRSIGPGDSVLDPFAGSGPILPAGNELKCRVTAIEVDPAAYALCVNRVKAITAYEEMNNALASR